MLGRSARKNRKRACHWCRPGTQGPRRRPGGLHDDGRRTRVRTTTIRRACRRPSRLPCHGSGSPQQAQNSNRSKECGGGCEQWFYCDCRCVVRLFSAGCSLGRRRPANIRLAPGVPRRLRPNLKPFVILNEVDRRTQRVQRPLADYAEQGGERQTKCSQESILGKNLFWARLQMFRCAQHDGWSGSSQRSERQTQCSQESVYVYFYTDSSSLCSSE
jgi:hypothetical protein